MAGKAVQITFREGVGTEEIHEALVRVIGGIRPEGCVTCGLIGFDVVLRASSDPAPYEAVSAEEVRALPKLLQVSVLRDNPNPSPW